MVFRKVSLCAAALLLSVAAARADGIADLQALSSRLSGQQASFTQSFTPKGFHTAQKENGAVVFGPLPQMRWEYTTPEQKLFVFDGATSWFFVPAEKQVTVHAVSAEERAGLPFVVISDRAGTQKAYEVSTRMSGTAQTIVMKARNPVAAVPAIVLTVGADGKLQRLDYSDHGGNRTVFDFAAWRPAGPGTAFRFEPPAGVQVVTD